MRTVPGSDLTHCLRCYANRGQGQFMKHQHKVQVEEDGEKAIEHARRAQLKKEVSKRLGQPGAIADLVRAEVVRLGFTPQEVYAEMCRQSQG